QVVLLELEGHGERIVEELGERVVGTLLADLRHERLQVDVEKLERLPQKRKLDRPLALLDEVQVRRRHADRLRDVALTHAPVHPDVPDPLADEDVVHVIPARVLFIYLPVYQLSCKTIRVKLANIVNSASCALTRRASVSNP